MSDWKPNWFVVEHLDAQRLLLEWRWLCPKPITLVARNAFGDLFLRDESGEMYFLDVAGGHLTRIADSEAQFRELAATPEKREEWFGEADELAGFARGLRPNASQCIGFGTPLVFGESGKPDNPYVADIYDHVSFLGDLHHHISGLPAGTKVRLQVKR